jgi:hypothetical protein
VRDSRDRGSWSGIFARLGGASCGSVPVTLVGCVHGEPATHGFSGLVQRWALIASQKNSKTRRLCRRQVAITVQTRSHNAVRVRHGCLVSCVRHDARWQTTFGSTAGVWCPSRPTTCRSVRPESECPGSSGPGQGGCKTSWDIVTSSSTIDEDIPSYPASRHSQITASKPFLRRIP